jgi:uncharacterized protein (TIGR02246 family)
MKRAGTYPVLITLIVLLGVSGTVQVAWAGDKEDVAVAIKRWAEAFAFENPSRIVTLYDREAVLWGTLSDKRRDTPAEIHDYFAHAFETLPGHTVSLGNGLIRVYCNGNIAINTGYYTFHYKKNGKDEEIPARYSFVYVKRGNGQWMIVDHHSSAMPKPIK